MTRGDTCGECSHSMANFHASEGCEAYTETDEPCPCRVAGPLTEDEGVVLFG